MKPRKPSRGNPFLMARKRNGVTTRRGFLEAATAAALALPGVAVPSFADSPAQVSGAQGEERLKAGDRDSFSNELTKSEIKHPRVLTEQACRVFPFRWAASWYRRNWPRRAGNLMDWEIFNKPESRQYSSIRISCPFGSRSATACRRASVLERRSCHLTTSDPMD